LQGPNLSHSEAFFEAVTAKFLAQSLLFYYKPFFKTQATERFRPLVA